MKRIIALFLVVLLVFSGCSINTPKNNKQEKTTQQKEKVTVVNDNKDNNTAVADIEDQVYKQVIDSIGDDYYVREVKAQYYSKEYLEEVDYNSKENVLFGYHLSDLDNSFGAGSYVFTLGKDGKTTVEAFKPYDDTTEKLVRNVAIGTGVIVVCVVIAAVSGGVGAPAVAAVFAASAKGAAIGAFSGAIIDGTVGGVTTAIATDGDKDAIIKSIKDEAGEGFKWGAIIGGVTGGISKAASIKKATSAGLKAREAVAIQKEAKWSTKVIKRIKSVDEYKVYKKAGLVEKTVNGKKALVLKNPKKVVKLKYKSNLNGKMVTNAQRMQKGLPPIEPKTGQAIELHHVGQTDSSPLAILTKSQHSGKNDIILHVKNKPSQINRPYFDKVVKPDFWKSYYKLIAG